MVLEELLADLTVEDLDSRTLKQTKLMLISCLSLSILTWSPRAWSRSSPWWWSSPRSP